MMTRLAIVSTHPIQYNAPVFQALARRECEIRVFYGWQGGTQRAVDHGFGTAFAWDIPLLDGYDYEFVRNVSRDPGPHHFHGVDLPDLHSRVTSWRPNALLVYGWCYRAHLRAVRYFHKRLPVLFRGDSNLLDERPGWKKIARRTFLTWLYRHVDMALCVGQQNRKYYQAMGLRDHQLVFAPHAIDNDRFRSHPAADRKAAAWRRELGIKDEDCVILFVGKLESKKSPKVLLRAFDLVSDQRTHLVFAGTGPLEGDLRKAARDRVHFLGFQNQSQMPSVYRLGDVLVLPSEGPGETWGLAINEAMAAGRAVIASDRAGAAHDLVTPGRNGWVFPARDEARLVELLSRAVSGGRDELLAMGAESAHIISSWTIGHQVEGILEALERAGCESTARQGTPGCLMSAVGDAA